MMAAGVAVAGLLVLGNALSQDTTPPGGRRQRDPEQARQRMEQFRQQAAERLRESLGATEEEMKVLQPRIENVQTLSRELRGGGRMGMGGRTGGRTGGRRGGATPPTAGDQPQPQSEMQKASQELAKVADNKESTQEQLRTALKNYRGARSKVEAELAAAQKSLQEVVTLQQEAKLVAMGLLK